MILLEYVNSKSNFLKEKEQYRDGSSLIFSGHIHTLNVAFVAGNAQGMGQWSVAWLDLIFQAWNARYF